MNITKVVIPTIKSSIVKNICIRSVLSYSSAAEVSSFHFKTKQELIDSPPKTIFNRKVPERKQYLIQGYYERLESPLVMVYQHNNLNVPEYRALQQQVLKLGCKVQVTRSGVFRTALKGSPFEAFQTLFKGPTLIIYNTEACNSISEKAKKVFDTLDKNKKLTFMGAKTENFLFSEATFHHFIKLPSIDVLQAQLLGSLQAVPSKVISLLSQESQLLSRLLDQHKQNLDK